MIGPALAFLPDDDTSADGGWLALDVSGAASVMATQGDQQTVSQASGALRLAILEVTDALTVLDAARWNSGVESLKRRDKPCLFRRIMNPPPQRWPRGVPS